MDLRAELEFQQQQLALEKQQVQALRVALAKAEQKVLIRQGAIAEVKRLMELQKKGDDGGAKDPDAE